MVTGLLFPSVEGKNLEGKTFQLPTDFPDKISLVIVAFQREQQREVNTWVPTARSLSDEYPGFGMYELPVLANPWRLMRGIIDGGMRSGISDPVARRTTITVYTDKSAFMDALKITTDDSIQTYLLDQEGRIFWHAEGPMDEVEENALRHEVEQRLGGGK